MDADHGDKNLVSKLATQPVACITYQKREAEVGCGERVCPQVCTPFLSILHEEMLEGYGRALFGGA